MKVDGACHCGRITYQAEIDPEKVGICHCTDCQSLSASAFRTVVFVDGDKFTISGEPRIYVKTGDSGNKRAQAFCPDCGSAIYATSAQDESPKVYNIRVGTLTQRAELTPRFQVWTRSALHWLDEIDNIPKRDKQ